MSLSLHKNTTEKSTREAKNDTKITVLDIEKEGRLAKVISLFSKGLSQEETAKCAGIGPAGGPQVTVAPTSGS
jgi:hypothetical protein